MLILKEERQGNWAAKRRPMRCPQSHEKFVMFGKGLYYHFLRIRGHLSQDMLISMPKPYVGSKQY
jgi:hypothetical protein